jgi:hypothetical protein
MQFDRSLSKIAVVNLKNISNIPSQYLFTFSLAVIPLVGIPLFLKKSIYFLGLTSLP